MKQRRLPLGGYRRWYAPEIRRLKDLAAAGRTYKEIASDLGRPVRSVQRICKIHAISVRRADGATPWTDAQLAVLNEEAQLMLRRVLGRLSGEHPVAATIDKAVAATIRAGMDVRRREREVAA